MAPLWKKIILPLFFSVAATVTHKFAIILVSCSSLQYFILFLFRFQAEMIISSLLRKIWQRPVEFQFCHYDKPFFMIPFP